MIRFTTNMGVIDIELDHERAPLTSANFETYVREGFYNGVIFHRVIPGFMIQGGGFLPGMHQKETHAPIQNEAANGPPRRRAGVTPSSARSWPARTWSTRSPR